MSLPPAFLDELRARTPLAALVGRRVKLARSGRNWKGCCPFHTEKTPSFYVYEDGYHCFGCGAHGDAVSFAMQTQGLTFPDAVAQLAAEAGLEVPKASPRAAEAERQRLDLGAVLEAAQVGFARRLREPEGAAGLAYLRERGLSEETIARFGLGWSGDGRGGLTRELGAKGVEPVRLLEAGLLRDSEGGERRELFFNRVTFPIRDRRGRVISFGGRTLGDGKPKYLNGPETALFQKRRTLFALDLAREGARKDKDTKVIVAEGYMDAIALHQAGFLGAVAPLGTALTAEQLEELWQVSPIPVLCFDGDAAGARATKRAVETALPMLTAGRGLSVVRLPSEHDPDSFIRKEGRQTFRMYVEAARPLDEVAFQILGEGISRSVEGRTNLRKVHDDAIASIQDRAVREVYRQALKAYRWAAGATSPGQRADLKRQTAVPSHLLLDPEKSKRERTLRLVALLLQHPSLLPDVDEAFSALDLLPPFAALREGIHAWLDTSPVLDSANLLSHLDTSGLAAEAKQVLASASMFLKDCAPSDAMPAEVADVWWHLSGLFRQDQLDAERKTAGRAFAVQTDGVAAQRQVVSLFAAGKALLAIGPVEDDEV